MKHRTASTRISGPKAMIIGFAAVILAGALLLCLPFSSRTGHFTSFRDCLFTATSAVCVTGLVVQDTAIHWSAFGQAVLLLLIQFGGLGFLTATVLFAKLSGRRVTLLQRTTLQETLAAPQLGGMVRLISFIVKGTLCIEGIGFLLLLIPSCLRYGVKGIWMALFHSVSAFCNAGFDVMGRVNTAYGSLSPFAGDPFVLTVIMTLITVGGIGFLTWEDILHHGCRFRRYRMQSKVILVTSGLLIVFPACLFFFFEYRGLSFGDRLLSSLFAAVTPRTAGFATRDYASMSESGRALSTVLMLIGGSPGSTAGGFKTTTLAVLAANCLSVFRRRTQTTLGGRSIADSVVKSAATLLMMYMVLFGSAAMVICLTEHLPMDQCLFECASAIGTVGLSTGLTPLLHTSSRMILIFLMFFGRIGGLTVIYAAVNKDQNPYAKRPVETITVG